MKKSLLGLILLMMVLATSCKDEQDLFIEKPSVTLLSPVNSSSGVDIAPTFTWEATDPSGKELTYDFMIGFASDKLYKQASGLTTTSYTFTDYAISKQKEYFWKVVAHSNGISGESEVWSFSSLPAPTAPTLVGPIDGEFVRSTLVLDWDEVQAAVGETIEYEVFFGSDKDNLEKVADVAGETKFEIDASTLEIGKVYYWAVSSSDKISGNRSAIAHFKKLMPGAPDEPELLAPDKADGGVTTADVTFEWSAVTDPEGDAVTYDIYYGEGFEATTLLAADLSTTTYTASGLNVNVPYVWKVVAKDASGNYTETLTDGFVKLGLGAPTAPVLADLTKGSMLLLDEAFLWSESIDPDGQTVTYDVYVDEVYPPVKKVGSDITDLTFITKNADLACDITNVKTFYAMIVAKDEDGNESKSIPIAFEPQMTGVYTDVRGLETNDYAWVRMGTRIWMSQNLRTKVLTDGSLIPDVGTYKPQKNESVLYHDVHPEFAKWHVGPDWELTNGCVYTWGCVVNDLIAPQGWHVMNNGDRSYMQSYTGHPKHCLGAWHFGGLDTYGLSYETAGWRYNSLKTDDNNIDGFRAHLEESRADLWVNGGNYNVFELAADPDNITNNNFNNKFRYFPYHSEMMFGIRLVKNE